MRTAHLQADLDLASRGRHVHVSADGRQVRIRLRGGLLAWSPLRGWRALRRERTLDGAHRVLTSLGLTGSLHAGSLPPIRIGHGVRPGWLLATLGVRRDRRGDRSGPREPALGNRRS